MKITTSPSGKRHGVSEKAALAVKSILSASGIGDDDEPSSECGASSSASPEAKLARARPGRRPKGRALADDCFGGPQEAEPSEEQPEPSSAGQDQLTVDIDEVPSKPITSPLMDAVLLLSPEGSQQKQRTSGGGHISPAPADNADTYDDSCVGSDAASLKEGGISLPIPELEDEFARVSPQPAGGDDKSNSVISEEASDARHNCQADPLEVEIDRVQDKTPSASSAEPTDKVEESSLDSEPAVETPEIPGAAADNSQSDGKSAVEDGGVVKRGRGRPKGSKNRPKPSMANSADSSPSGLTRKSRGGLVRSASSLSSTPSAGSPASGNTPRSYSPAGSDAAEDVKCSSLPAPEESEMPKNQNEELNPNDPRPSDQSPLPGKKKKLAKMSDSEDSSVSTDSPLKPKIYGKKPPTCTLESPAESPVASPCSSGSRTDSPSAGRGRPRKRSLETSSPSSSRDTGLNGGYWGQLGVRGILRERLRQKGDDNDSPAEGKDARAEKREGDTGSESAAEAEPLYPKHYHTHRKELELGGQSEARDGDDTVSSDDESAGSAEETEEAVREACLKEKMKELQEKKRILDEEKRLVDEAAARKKQEQPAKCLEEGGEGLPPVVDLQRDIVVAQMQTLHRVEDINIKEEDEVKPKLSEAELKKIEISEKKEVEQKLKSFRNITENLYLCPRKVNKQSRKMQCDCTISKEEIKKGEKGKCSYDS